ncbi:hypothetical protein PENTCL1PPCAC_25599, partial [Pristionchus entomophagus]
MSDSDDGVSPRKQRRVEKKKKRRDHEEADRDLFSSEEKRRREKNGRAVTKEKSPERKKKGRKSAEMQVDAAFKEEEDDTSDGAPTENSVDRDDGEGASYLSDDREEEANARFRLKNGTDDDCFEIPERDDDLLFAGKVGYKMDEVMETDEAMASIEAFEDEIHERRWRCLYERFPAFFALVRSPSDGSRVEVPLSLRSRLVTSLVLAYSHMSPDLKSVLSSAASGAPNKKIRAKCRDMSDHVLMLIYLLHKIILIFETEAKSIKRKQGGKRGGGGRGRPKKGRAVQNDEGDMLSGDDGEMEGGAEDESSWEENRQRVLETLTEMVNVSVRDNEGNKCEFALKFLWSAGGHGGKQTMTTLLKSAAKFLDNPDITRQPSRPVLTCVFKLIRALCNNFKHYTYIGGFLFEKLLSLDYYKEGAATTYPFIERIKAVSVDNDMQKLIEGMLEYFKKTPVAISNTNAKAVCLFMTSITEQEPYRVLFAVAPFLGLLTDENASVRSTVLQVITMLLTQNFLDPTIQVLSERFTNARNNMFDHLLQHVRDVNANVRASTLKCLTSMAKAQKIPPKIIKDGLVQLVGQRIGDDKVAVRKEAVRFATTFLENNPYGHDFDRIANEKALKEIIQKRDKARSQGADAESEKEATNLFDSFKEALAEEVEKCADEYMMGSFSVPTDDERREMYRNFQERQENNAYGSDSQSQPSEEALTMRWLFTMLLSEEKGVKIPARLLLAMAITDQLKAEHCSSDSVLLLDSSGEVVKAVMDAGHRLFVNTASMIIGRNEEAILRKEQQADRMKELDRLYSKDIDALVMKLVLEHELAQCLPAVMSSVMAGEGSDLKLGIDFVVKCKEFNISGSEAAVRQLCGLVWKSDEEGRKQILTAASSMFISSNQNPRLRDAATCENILNLVKSMSDHERGSVEQVLALTTRYEPIPIGVYNLLWEQVDENTIGKKTSTDKMRKQVTSMKALCLLSRTDVVRNRKWLRRYQNIVKLGWPEIASEALGCIANLATRHSKDDKPAAGARPFRIPSDDSLFLTTQQFMLSELCREESRTWNRSLRATLDIYFHLCMESSKVVAGFVGKMLWLLRRTSHALRFYDQQMGVEPMGSSQRGSDDATIDPIQKELLAEDRSKFLTRLWSVLLERLFVLIGEVAVRMLVHADYVFVREFIQARARISATKEKSDGAISRFPARPLQEWEENSVLRRGIFDWGTGSTEDQELTGLSEDERIREIAREMIDNRLVTSGSLLGRVLPIVVHSVRAKGTPPRLRFQAMSALAKVMLVSPHIAQCGARIFFAFLNNGPSPILRSNLTVIAADLTYRHPNLVENHASALFAQLQDGDSCVRESCVLILNHLISNDLIKTHVILAYALLGYIDPVPSIQHLTRGLFHEWAKKEGIMNHVPSFITRISADSRALPLGSFRTIMNQFIPLIRERKDADVQALVIKLCKRIEFAKNPSCQVRNPDMPAYFSHCLQLLTLNAKGFNKLCDCLHQYQPYLGDDRVYEDISSLVKVFQKDDLKANGGFSDLGAEITVFLNKLAKLHEELKNENEVEGMVARMQFGGSGGAKGQSSVARKMRARRAIAGTAATPARQAGGRMKKGGGGG